MRQSALSRYLEHFHAAVDDAIKETSSKTGITDLETVYQYLKKKTSMLWKRLAVLLADQQIRVIIQKRMKKCAVSVAEAATQSYRNAKQIEFDFFGMEQFRGVGQRISYRIDAGDVQYVEYNRSTEAQRVASIQHLGMGIRADIARRDAEIAANDWLHPLVVQYGDLPAERLVSLWLIDQEGGEVGTI